MLLTLILLTTLVLIGLALTVGLLGLLDVLFGSPAAAVHRVDTRLRAAQSLIHEPDSTIAHREFLRNLSQSA